MMKRVCFYLFSALLIIFISSCSSTRSMKKGVSIGNLSESEYMEELISRSPGWDAITAKMSLAVDLNGKGPTKVNGTLRMKRDEVIQLSIAPFLGIEVARAEISPDGVLVMDRMNKRYVQVPFDELKNLAKADLDFHTLQALFMNEIFLPGKKVLTVQCPNNSVFSSTHRKFDYFHGLELYRWFHILIFFTAFITPIGFVIRIVMIAASVYALSGRQKVRQSPDCSRFGSPLFSLEQHSSQSWINHIQFQSQLHHILSDNCGKRKYISSFHIDSYQ